MLHTLPKIGKLRIQQNGSQHPYLYQPMPSNTGMAKQTKGCQLARSASLCPYWLSGWLVTFQHFSWNPWHLDKGQRVCSKTSV